MQDHKTIKHMWKWFSTSLWSCQVFIYLVLTMCFSLFLLVLSFQELSLQFAGNELPNTKAIGHTINLSVECSLLAFVSCGLCYCCYLSQWQTALSGCRECVCPVTEQSRALLCIRKPIVLVTLWNSVYETAP